MEELRTPQPQNTSGEYPAPPEPLRCAVDDPHQLATVYLQLETLSRHQWQLRYYREEFWEYLGGHYLAVASADLRARVTRLVREHLERHARNRAAEQEDSDSDSPPPTVRKVTRYLVGNVIQALEGMCLVSSSVDMPVWLNGRREPERRNLIALNNGLVDVDRLLRGESDVLQAHSPQWFSPFCLPYDFDPAATCRRWLQFLRQMLEGDAERIAELQEWFGLCLIPDTSFQRALLLEGEGSNGKKVVLDMLEAVLGRANVSHVGLELFSQRFQLTTTLGKLANVVREIGPMNRVDEGTFKTFTSGEPMHFDRKGLPPIAATPTARLAFATNEVPRFVDRSEGVWRRLIVMPFRVVIPKGQQDRGLSETLQSELPGVFVWAVEGLRRLLQQGHFTEAALCQEALREHRLESNPARAFLQDRVACDAAATVRTDVLYDAYVGWSQARGYRVLDERQFGKEVRRAFKEVTRERLPGGRNDARPYVYRRIRLLAEDPMAGLTPAPPPPSR